jgi:hypothetical protein
MIIDNINHLILETELIQERFSLKGMLRKVFKRTQRNQVLSPGQIKLRNSQIHLSIRRLKKEYNRPIPKRGGTGTDNAEQIIDLIAKILPNHY